MVTAHISKNLRRYAVGAGATGVAALAAKPAGKQVGKASVGKSDPHYDMNRRAGESIFHTRKQKIDSSRLKKRGLREANDSKPIRYATISTKKGSKPPPHIARALARFALSREEGIEEAGSRTFGKGMGRITRLNIKPDDRIGKAVGKAVSKTLSRKPGVKQVVPAAATAAAAGIIGKRAKSGAEQGRYEKRRSGTQQGYTDAYKKTYGRQEGIDEANVAGGVRKIGGKLKAVGTRPGVKKGQQAIRWGGRGVAALDLAVLGAAGAGTGVKKIRGGKEREEGLDEAGGVRRIVKKGLKPVRNRLAAKTNQARKLRKPSGKRFATAKGARHLARTAVGAEAGMGALYAGGAAAGAYGVKKQLSKKREEGLTEGRIKGSGLRKVGGYIEKGDVGLFGISTGRAIKGKGQDVADDQKLNKSHLRRANNG